MNRLVRLQFILSVAVAVIAGCKHDEDKGPTKAEPAQVARHVDESELNTITLTEQAEQRLGIQIFTAQLADVQRTRTVGGEVMIPPGHTIIVSAPLAGTLLPPQDAGVPVPGKNLEAGQAVFRFEPLLSPERDVLTPSEQVRIAQTKADLATAQIDAQLQVESAKIAVEAAQIAYDRAVQLLKNKAGSQRSVDEAVANLRLAQESQTTAETRHQHLSNITLDEQAGQLATHTLVSPVAGVLQSLEAAAGEIVSAGQPLFSVMKMDRVWVRAPVYVGRRRDVDMAQPARLAEYGQRPDVPDRSASYVDAPPTANANAATVDLYYELPNQDGKLYPGQRVAVTVPLHSRAQSLVVPYKAIVYDILGGTWVYEQTDGHVYVRRRVALEYVDDEDAILAAGPQAGAKIVTDGAAELFGTEFGVGH